MKQPVRLDMLAPAHSRGHTLCFEIAFQWCSLITQCLWVCLGVPVKRSEQLGCLQCLIAPLSLDVGPWNAGGLLRALGSLLQELTLA